jgi:hypothetical protein
MGLGQWIVIIILIAIIVFGFVAVFDFSKGVISNVYPQTPTIEERRSSNSIVSLGMMMGGSSSYYVSL